MSKCTVIGSGPSGLHFAQTALELGYEVEMIDVGYSAPPAIEPDDSFQELKSHLSDPATYLLGSKMEGVLLPGQQEEFYGIPPSKNYALNSVAQLRLRTEKFKPMFSFAQGGLAQMWTAGCYPFNEAETADYPFAYEELLSCYEAVAKRIGVNGIEDDLASIVPFHENIQAPLPLDAHSTLLYEKYKRNRKLLKTRYGCSFGRARHAVLSEDIGDRKSCQQLGRCLWGCPIEALYVPSVTLRECMAHPKFTYHGNRYVTHFEYSDDGRINQVVTETVGSSDKESYHVENLVLAAGTLSTSKIFLESIFRKTGEVIKLKGLMDNRQVIVPFLNLKMIGKPSADKSYQYNQLAMELEGESDAQNIHCLITTLKTAMIHPVIEKFPADLKTAIKIFKNIHAALGAVNINFHDTRRDDCYVTLEKKSENTASSLIVHYSSPENEDKRIVTTIKRLKSILWKLGCIVPPGMNIIRPMGASVHYSGTIPMTVDKQPWSVSADCRSHDFENLYIVDGSTYPFLPAKNITFTLMANAVRVARNMKGD